MEKNRPINHLIDALIEWNEPSRDCERAHDLNTLVSLLNIEIGGLSAIDDVSLNLDRNLEILENRVIELSDKFGINEVIIIRGLISFLTDYFGRGYKSLVTNLKMRERIISKQGYCSDIFDKFIKVDYEISLEFDEIDWNVIVSKRLNEYQLYSFEQSLMLNKIKQKS